jgi:hypothetical protein
MMELTVAFRNFAKAPKNKLEQPVYNMKKTCKTKLLRAPFRAHLLLQDTMAQFRNILTAIFNRLTFSCI